MLKKFVFATLFSMSLLTTLSTPAEAHITTSTQEVKVYKFNKVRGELILERSYHRRWGAIVIDRSNKYLIEQFESIADYPLYITELVLLDGELRLVNLKSYSVSLEFQIQIYQKRICARNPETDDFDLCHELRAV